jgi:hypothetical protein
MKEIYEKSHREQHEQMGYLVEDNNAPPVS